MEDDKQEVGKYRKDYRLFIAVQLCSVMARGSKPGASGLESFSPNINLFDTKVISDSSCLRVMAMVDGLGLRLLKRLRRADMANEEHLKMLRQGGDNWTAGITAWNTWRENNPETIPDLSETSLVGEILIGANLYKAKLRETNLSLSYLVRADLRRADLRRAILRETDLRETDLREANLTEANLYKGKARVADLRGAKLRGAYLGQVDFTGANLRGADLMFANATRAKLANADLTGCQIFGISAWNVNLEGANQQDLIITPPNETKVTVDNIEVAQFIYLLLHNEKIRDIIDTITSKAVLILGRFTPERKAILNTLRERLRTHNRTPIIFDFDQPVSKNITDTVKLLAQMARYIIVDLSDPNSAPYELGIISMLGLDSTPVVPIIVDGQRPFPMLVDVLQKKWSTELVTYQDLDDLTANLDEKLVNVAEAKVRELRGTNPEVGGSVA